MQDKSHRSLLAIKLSLLFTLLAASMWAQDKFALQKKSQDLKFEIQKLNVQAQQTKKQAKQTSHYLNTLNKKISISRIP